MPRQILLEKLNEAASDVTVSGWLVSIGDAIAEGDPIMSVETDKVVVDLPAPIAGRVAALLVDPGQTVKVGQPILELE